MDDQSQFGYSPNKRGNNDTNRGSPSKISPNKTAGGTNSKQFTDNSHSNNGQVMTQISAIYNKRSRSILNQFG